MDRDGFGAVEQNGVGAGERGGDQLLGHSGEIDLRDRQLPFERIDLPQRLLEFDVLRRFDFNGIQRQPRTAGDHRGAGGERAPVVQHARHLYLKSARHRNQPAQRRHREVELLLDRAGRKEQQVEPALFKAERSYHK